MRLLLLLLLFTSCVSSEEHKKCTHPVVTPNYIISVAKGNDNYTYSCVDYSFLDNDNNCIQALRCNYYCFWCDSYTQIDTMIFCGTFQIDKK